MLSIETRNQIAFRKLIRVAKKQVLIPISAKIWNLHIHQLDITTFDYNSINKLLVRILLSPIDVQKIINDLHQEHAGIVLEDKAITLTFIDRCKRICDE